MAGVPFLDISTYDRHVVHGYVGSMYGYSGDISVKQSPEDFVYWTPRNVSYSTSYITYTLDKEYHIVAESKPHSGQFFYKHKDGSGQAYCTFMGSDTTDADCSSSRTVSVTPCRDGSSVRSRKSTWSTVATSLRIW